MSDSTGTGDHVYHNGFGYISLTTTNASFRGFVSNVNTYFDIVAIGI